MTTPLTSSNEDIPNGQLMQLALEVMSQAIGSRQDDDQSSELTSEHNDLALGSWMRQRLKELEARLLSPGV